MAKAENRQGDEHVSDRSSRGTMLNWKHERYCWIPASDTGMIRCSDFDVRMLTIYLSKLADRNGVVLLGSGDHFRAIAGLVGAHANERRALFEIVRRAEKSVGFHFEKFDIASGKWLFDAGEPSPAPGTKPTPASEGAQMLLPEKRVASRPVPMYRVVIGEYKEWQRTTDTRRRLYERESKSFARLGAFPRMLAAELIRTAAADGTVEGKTVKELARCIIDRTSTTPRADARAVWEKRLVESAKTLVADGFLVARKGTVKVKNFASAQKSHGNDSNPDVDPTGRGRRRESADTATPPDVKATASDPKHGRESAQMQPSRSANTSTCEEFQVPASVPFPSVPSLSVPTVPAYSEEEMSFSKPPVPDASDSAPSRGVSDETPTAFADEFFEEFDSPPSPPLSPEVTMPDEKPTTSAPDAPPVPEKGKQGVLALEAAPVPREAVKGKARRGKSEKKPALPFTVAAALGAFKAAAGRRYVMGSEERWTEGWVRQIQKHIRKFPEIRYWEIVGAWLNAGGDAFRKQITTPYVATDAFIGLIETAIEWDADGRPAIGASPDARSRGNYVPPIHLVREEPRYDASGRAMDGFELLEEERRARGSR